MQGLLILLLLCSSGNGYGLAHQKSKERIDKIEFNTTYAFKESEGKVVKYYSQMIVWDWNSDYGRYDVVAHFTLEDNDRLNFTKVGPKYYVSYISLDDIQYCFETDIIVYTKSHIDDDPEGENSHLLPVDKRRKLIK